MATRHPVTVSGWYENADGTWTEYVWRAGILCAGRTQAEPETATERDARRDAGERAMRASAMTRTIIDEVIDRLGAVGTIDTVSVRRYRVQGDRITFPVASSGDDAADEVLVDIRDTLSGLPVEVGYTGDGNTDQHGRSTDDVYVAVIDGEGTTVGEMRYRFTVTGGAYEGSTWTGQIADVPTTIIVPEGIVSARTNDEAGRLRATVADWADGADPVLELSAANWAWRVERVGEGSAS